MKTPILAGALTAMLLMTTTAIAQPAPDGPPAPGMMHAGPTGMHPMMHPSILSISAYGEIKAAPDMASISLGVQTQAPTAARAMADNAGRMSEVVAVLKRSGIEAKDIQTSGLNLGAQYDYQPNQPPKLTGYQASNQVTVTVNDLAKLGAALDAVVAAGANQINGVSFGLRDPQAAEDAARLKAVAALQAKAQLYAGAVGMHVEKLVSLNEGGGQAQLPRPMMMRSMAVTAGAESTPVEAGQLDVRVDVSATYELAK